MVAEKPVALADAIPRLCNAGIARVLLEVSDLSRDEVLRVLDQNAPLAT